MATIRKSAITLIALLLAACGGGSSTASKPIKQGGAPSPPTTWTLWFSPGVTLKAGPSFDFPTWISASCPGPTGFNQTCPAVHYLVNKSGPLIVSKSITLNITITGTAPQWNYANIEADSNTCTNPASVRLFIQEAGDNWSGSGAYAYYRWWSNPIAATLQPGTYTITVPLTPDNWSSVMGEVGNASTAATNGFNQAILNAQTLGMTFGGGCFFGHGVDLLAGSATFKINSFTVQ